MATSHQAREGGGARCLQPSPPSAAPHLSVSPGRGALGSQLVFAHRCSRASALCSPSFFKAGAELGDETHITMGVKVFVTLHCQPCFLQSTSEAQKWGTSHNGLWKLIGAEKELARKQTATLKASDHLFFISSGVFQSKIRKWVRIPSSVGRQRSCDQSAT